MFPWKTLPLTESEPEEAEEGLFAITIAITEGILEMSALHDDALHNEYKDVF